MVGLDGAYVLGWGDKQPVLVAVDLGTDEPLAVGYVNEYNPQAVRRWLAPLVQQLGISVIVTDDLFSYKLVAEKLQLGHQVCQFHVRRWVGRTLRELQETVPQKWLWVLDEIHNSWKCCHPMAVNTCTLFGSNCPIASLNLTNLVLLWNNYVICSCV